MKKGKIKLRVMQILRDHEETRSSDQLLLARYWHTYHKDLLRIGSGESQAMIRLQDIQHLTSAESITRNRRKIQSEGLYVSDKKAQEYRQERQQEVAKWSQGVSTNNPF